ncbi:glycosyltransferase family 4 protein [Psychrobacter sp.]|uniref:glycosyltransferase family 4 protein n=1 Tax=Psychrobacter sp. TaxID=56811 RepID=UPI003BAF0A32
MKILHVLLTQLSIPPKDYGGTERVLWGLYQGQKELGHDVRFLTKYKSSQDDALYFDEQLSLESQVEGWADIIHFHFRYEGDIETPFVCTEHSNSEVEQEYPVNTIYLSKKHAENYNATCYVHNGLYWGDYGEPNFNPKNYIHFLAKASWRIKNIQGAVKIARKVDIPLHVLGGERFNIRRNPYFYMSSKLTFHGMIGGTQKNQLVSHSKGLIFPVLWHEPFGLAVIESLYLGCPVLATPFGALPDIITQENIGVLSDSYTELTEATKNIDKFDRRACHDHARMYFSHLAMARGYIQCYEKVLAGEALNMMKPRAKANIKARLQMKN